MSYWPLLVRENEHPSTIGVDAHAISKGRFLVDSLFTHTPHQASFALPGTRKLQVMVRVPGQLGEGLIQG
jgi:hypothetical protein